MNQLNEVICIQEDSAREEYDIEDEDKLVSIQEDSFEVESEVSNKVTSNDCESKVGQRNITQEDNEDIEKNTIQPDLQIYTSQEDLRPRSKVEAAENLEELESVPSVIHVGETKEQSSCSVAVRKSGSPRKMLKNKLLSLRSRCRRFFHR